ncbi:MAG: hypothetical protein M1814_005475 [Vezdaea aestivalis]|nr:MAG: hypothetical protein M1814_005475 [Vezdaea aestivalis]
MALQDFLSSVTDLKAANRELSRNISEIAILHQQALSSTTRGQSNQLEHKVTQTQLLIQKLKGDIRRLEQDAVDSAAFANDTTKQIQIKAQKREFERQLRDYEKDEQSYRHKYQEQIARQYRIVNPDASPAEVQEAAETDWGNEGVFQTALKSNRGAQSSSVLQSVRARHNEIVEIEKTMNELAQIFIELNEIVVAQEAPVQHFEEQTEVVNTDLEGGNKELKQSIWHARNIRKLKWWILAVVLLIIIIVIAAVLGWCYTSGPCKTSNGNGGQKTKRSMSCALKL